MRTANDNSDWLVCEQTRLAAAQLGLFLRKAVTAEDMQIRVMALDLIERGGKRLRPSLLFLAATYGEFVQEPLMRAAAALELVHIASLHHDDVMDRAPMRRNGASVNARWGNALAALAGTYLFARASALLASLGDIPNQMASQASVELCAGQLQEVENAYNLELTEAGHLNMLVRKTATLFELPCRLGAHLSGASAPHAEALAIYGRHLGLAFQLTDDVLDLNGKASQLGKATGVDLREGVYSLPVLRAVRQQDAGGQRLRELLGQAWLAEEDAQTALQLVRESAGVASTLAVAREHAQHAREALATLPEGPARYSLCRLAEYVVTRDVQETADPD